MPVNVLFASWYIGLGGGETDLLTLAQTLDPARYVPHLLVPREGQLAQKWRDHGWTVHILPFRGVTTYFVPWLWQRLPVVNQLQALLQNYAIGLVHSDYHTLPFVVGACQPLQIPYLWTVHGWWFKPHAWQRAFFRQIPAVARSYSVQHGFLGEPPFMPIDHLPVIYSGVDTDRFQPNVDGSLREELGFEAQTPLVAMIARFQSVKGHEVFQQMAQQVVLQIPNAHFVVAGEDIFGVTQDRDYKEYVLAQASTHPILRTHLHYIGFRDDVERVMAMADVVVCASDFESYGKVNLEAMACGKAVVSTNRGGPSETIVHGETGYLVPPQDPQAMALEVIRLLRDADERQRLGQHGRERVMTMFSASQMCVAYTQLFDQLLNLP